MQPVQGGMILEDVWRVDITAPPGSIRRFSTLLVHGCAIVVPAGITVRELLTDRLKIDPGLFEKGIQTILHDGRPVDDPAVHMILTDSAIALSGALPGLFGAAFRKKGEYAAIRHLPGANPNHPEADGRIISITLKLFNTAAETIGPDLLKQGIRISAEVFLDFWKRHPELTESPLISEIRINGVSKLPADIAGHLPDGCGDIFLTITAH